MSTVRALSQREIAWRRGADPAGDAYEADVDGARLTLRVGDFPAEPLYSVFVDGHLAGTLDSWPTAWRRPPAE